MVPTSAGRVLIVSLPAGFRRHRWTGFALLATAFVLGFFHRIAPAVVAPDLVRDFGIPAATLGSLAAIYYYVYTALQIPAGIVADTLGPRYTVGGAFCIAALGSLVFALADQFAVAALGRVLVGMGVAFTFVGLMKFNTLWFPAERYGAISGLTLLVGNLGAILGAAPLALVLNLLSWREVFVGIAAGSAILAVLILLLLRNRPQDAGLPSLGQILSQPEPASQQRHWTRQLAGALTNRHIWTGFVVMFGITGTVLAFVGLWGVPLLIDVHGMSRPGAANVMTVMLLGSAVGSFFAGSLSDRIGRRRPIPIAAGVVATACWLWLLWLPWGPGLSAVLLFGMLGACAGGGTVAYAVAKEVAPPLNAGMAIAIVNTGLFLGAAVSQWAFGWVMDQGWHGELSDGLRLYGAVDYGRGLGLCAVFAAIGLLAALGLKETGCRNISRALPDR